MSAPKTDTAIVPADKNPNVRIFVFGDAERSLAASLGLETGGTLATRVNRAVEKTNSALRLVVEAGLELLSVRVECEHGEFQRLLEERGLPPQRAHEAMTYARFAASLSTSERDKVLSLSKTKVLELAKADPEVLQDLFESDGALDELTALSVRDMRVAIRTANAKVSDLSTQNETLERERDRLKDELRQLREGRVKTGGPVPIAVQDVRLECAALHKKASMSIEDIGRLATEHLANGAAEEAEWNVPVARHLYASLASLHAMASGLMSQLRDSYGARVDVTLLGVAPVTYGAAVTRGDRLKSDAQGRAIPAAAGEAAVGTAEVSGVAGDRGAVLISRT